MSEKDTRPSALQVAESLEGTNARVDDADNEGLPADEAPYTIFTKSQKLGIVLLVALASVYSPLSSFIYYPALTAVANDLHTTLSKVNLTITSYMVVSGVTPMILGGIADQLGRRPVYLLAFSMYVLANLGLALQTSYPALLLLRMLQSAGGSATIGLGYGVVGDIAESSDRGAYMGILGCGPNVAPSLGPVLGGVLAQKAGWRWIFGFLAISGALSLLLITVVLPETARNIVGNGSRPSVGLNKSILTLWLEKKNILSNRQQTGASERVPRIAKLRIPNPIGTISILLSKDTAPIVFVNAVFYTAYSCLQASLSSLFINIYGYKELEAGLIYIPFGVGCFVASLLSSKLRRCLGLFQDLSRIGFNVVRCKEGYSRMTTAALPSAKVFTRPATTPPDPKCSLSPYSTPVYGACFTCSQSPHSVPSLMAGPWNITCTHPFLSSCSSSLEAQSPLYSTHAALYLSICILCAPLQPRLL